MPDNRKVVVASRGALAEAFLRWNLDVEARPEDILPRDPEQTDEEYAMGQADCLLSYLSDSADEGSALVAFPRAAGITTAAAADQVRHAVDAVAMEPGWDPADEQAYADAAVPQETPAEDPPAGS